MIDKQLALTFLGCICLGALTKSTDVIKPINRPDFIRLGDQNVVLLEYGQNHPENEGNEKVALTGHSCRPHLPLDLTGQTQTLFKVTTDSTSFGPM